MRILDFGCGNKKFISNNSKDIVIGMDIAKLQEVDKVHNLEKFPWPFKNNEFDVVVSNHTLEHLSDLVKTMEEIHRIAKPNAIIKFNIPYFASCGAFQDPTHKRFFTFKTFDYFSENNDLNYYTTARFKILNKKLSFFVTRPILSMPFDFLVNLNQKFYEKFFSRMFPAENLYVELKVIK